MKALPYLLIFALIIISNCDKSEKKGSHAVPPVVSPKKNHEETPQETKNNTPPVAKKTNSGSASISKEILALKRATAINSKYWEIVPGKSIGPIEIGTKKSEINSILPLKTHPKFSRMTIPFSLYYRDEKVNTLKVSLKYTKKDIKVGNTIIPKDATKEEIVNLLKDCEDDIIYEGGTSTPCRKGSLVISRGSGGFGKNGPPEIWLRVTGTP